MYSMLRKALGENFLPEMAFAWKALHLDATVKNVTGQIWASSRPGMVSLRGVGYLGVWVGVSYVGVWVSLIDLTKTLYSMLL